MAKVVRRVARKTMLVVGEGDTEVAFLKHLRTLYCANYEGVAATPSNAHGKGPTNVIDHTAKQARNGGYDLKVALLDTDIPWTDQLQKLARSRKIEMVGSTPCIEGLYLQILGRNPPDQSLECKKVIKQLLSCDLTDWENYEQHFPKDVLQAARGRIAELDRLLGFFEGR
jgi:hypothetical protein